MPGSGLPSASAAIQFILYGTCVEPLLKTRAICRLVRRSGGIDNPVEQQVIVEFIAAALVEPVAPESVQGRIAGYGSAKLILGAKSAQKRPAHESAARLPGPPIPKAHAPGPIVRCRPAGGWHSGRRPQHHLPLSSASHVKSANVAYLAVALCISVDIHKLALQTSYSGFCCSSQYHSGGLNTYRCSEEC